VIAHPFRWTRSLQVLQGDGLPIEEFPQTPARLTVATTAVDKVRNGIAMMRGTGANPTLLVLNPTPPDPSELAFEALRQLGVVHVAPRPAPGACSDRRRRGDRAPALLGPDTDTAAPGLGSETRTASKGEDDGETVSVGTQR
jgi:hypothetical protein